MSRKPAYFEIFATSLGALLLEISYTRIFSFKVFYYFTYVILGIGLLGLGAGGIAVAMSERLRRADPERVLGTFSVAAGLSVLLGYFLVAPLGIDIGQHPGNPVEISKLLAVSLVLTSSFFAVGVVLSTILARDTEHAGKLYGLDLAGAAIGAAIAVPLIANLTPPRTVFVAGALLALAGFRPAGAVPRLRGVMYAVAAACLVFAAVPRLAPEPRVATGKAFDEFSKDKRLRFSAWSSVFRVDVMDHPFFLGEQFVLFHDGQPGSGMRRFTGDFEPFRYLDKDTRALPFSVLPPHPRILVIGAAGGHELVASLYFGAEHVTGVELNPVTYSLLTDVYADITGHLAQNPKVTLLNGDGRWFLKQTKEKFDLIWFVAPDSYAAMNAATSGAFVLSESYLYTTEMITESFRHLTDSGIICTQFGELQFDRKPNRTTRYLMTARAALSEEGIKDFPDHVLVSAGLGIFFEPAVLLGKKAFSDSQVDAFVKKTSGILGGRLVYARGHDTPQTPPTRAITSTPVELLEFVRTYPYQVDPVRDDSPFFWHFARFSDALGRALPTGGWVDTEDTIAEQVTLAFLGLVLVLGAAFLILPLLRMRTVFRALPQKLPAGIYFASLGLGFMFLEVGLMQKLTLLLGYPTYSLSVTLAALLVFTGTGSYLSERWRAPTNTKALAALGALSVCVLALRVGLPVVIDAFVGHALPVRVLVTVLVIAPVGLCLGMFMPLGLKTVASLAGDRSREYVAWAWAINGFFSVLASVLSTMLAMVIGFKALMLVSLAVYAIGVTSLIRSPAERASMPT